jgi:hypothetical protein
MTETSRYGCKCDCHGPPNVESVVGADNKSTNALVSSLDEAISRARDHLRTLLHRRNDLIPASKLPAELLSRIFVILQQQQSGPAERKWLSASYVCQQWRAVYVGTPRLWTSVAYESSKTSSRDQTPEYLEMAREHIIRAKNLPLSIKFSGWTTSELDEALSHFQRTCLLHVSFSRPEQIKAINLCFKQPNLELQALILQEGGIDGSVVVPDMHKAPSLRVLILENTRSLWPSTHCTFDNPSPQW